MYRKRTIIVLVAALAMTLIGANESADYRIAGDYFETCSCSPGCPCIFTSDATHGHCNASIIWRVNEGHLGDVELNGLTVVVALSAKGNMAKSAGSFAGVLYVDEKATPEQQQALATIYHSRFGGLFGSMAGPKAVPIQFAKVGDSYSVKIEGTLDAAIKPLAGAGGKTPEIRNAPFALVDTLMAGVSLRHSYTDEDLDSWEYEGGRNGFFALFDYASATD